MKTWRKEIKIEAVALLCVSMSVCLAWQGVNRTWTKVAISAGLVLGNYSQRQKKGLEWLLGLVLQWFEVFGLLGVGVTYIIACDNSVLRRRYRSAGGSKSIWKIRIRVSSQSSANSGKYKYVMFPYFLRYCCGDIPVCFLKKEPK